MIALIRRTRVVDHSTLYHRTAVFKRYVHRSHGLEIQELARSRNSLVSTVTLPEVLSQPSQWLMRPPLKKGKHPTEPLAYFHRPEGVWG